MVAITIIDEKRQHVQNDFEDRVEAPPPWGGPRDVLGQPPPSRPGPSSWEATECWPGRSSRSPTYAPSERAMTFALKRTFRLS